MLRMRLPVLLLLALSLAACMATNPYAPVPKELALRVRAYEAIARWGDLLKLYAFVEPGAKVELPPTLGKVRVTHYEAGDMRELPDGRWAQTAVIEYVLTDQQVVRKVIDRQVWHSPDGGKSWFRNPLPRELFR